MKSQTLLALQALSVILSLLSVSTNAACIESNPEFEDFFKQLNDNADSLPLPDSCCMRDVCGLGCPETSPVPTKGYGIAVAISIVVSFVVGVATYFVVKGESENFFVAGRSLPLWIVTITLSAQSIDSNAILGNVDLSYKYHFWDGVVIPMGLGLSLIINGIFLAHHVNSDLVLTLPDIFAKRYGRTVEVIISLITVCSFLMLLAGNLVGFGAVASYVWQIEERAAIWISALVVWCYTVSGGLFSVAYTDVVQGIMGWSGCIVTVYYLITNAELAAPAPSIGFPGYIYPDNIGDGGICDMYNGTQCNNDATLCCYNSDLWCPDGLPCLRADNGAYPIGDRRIFPNQMTDPLALSPFPNAIFWNWSTIFILGLGNLAALDFQARSMASKTPRVARLGCIFGGLLTCFIGIPFAYLGAITRVHYGPDSKYAQFTVDSCSETLGLPTCAAWEPDPSAFLKLLTNEAPSFLGAWCLIGIVAASMSTADGAILAMGTVMSHNVARQFEKVFPRLINSENLLNISRITTIPFMLISAFVAAFYRSSHSAGATGYLLIVAFDIVFGTVVVPLFGCFYAKNPSPRAALISTIGGVLTRVILEFVLPKDGYLLLPYNEPEFLDYGPAASTGFPAFVDVPAEEIWDPSVEPCVQERFEDYTGVDSLAGFLVCFVCFVSIQLIESKTGPLFYFPGSEGYLKDAVVSKENNSDGEGAVSDSNSSDNNMNKVKSLDSSNDNVERADA